ncbi:MAG: hypothetical protein K6E34_11935 [Lachnospiraceae bacterium]|nr:hypothetical protein [Lachnospiraceae bacterium]
MRTVKPEKQFAVFLIILILLLAVADYFLFREFDFVWPFFLMPYLVFSIFFLVYYFRSKEFGLFTAVVFMLIIIPVFAGLTMSIGWMINIDFFGEMIRRLTS